MKLPKAVAFLLVAAIASPLCCCLSFGYFSQPTGAKTTMAADHSCCEHGSSEQSSSNEDSQSHGECLHKADQLSKIPHSDLGDFLQKPGDYLIALLPVSLDFSPTKLAIDSTQLLRRVSLSMVGGSVAQAYCVYIL